MLERDANTAKKHILKKIGNGQYRNFFPLTPSNLLIVDWLNTNANQLVRQSPQGSASFSIKQGTKKG